MTVEQLLREKREQVLQVPAKHGAHMASMFGSVACRNTHERSDTGKFEPGSPAPRSNGSQARTVRDAWLQGGLGERLPHHDARSGLVAEGGGLSMRDPKRHLRDVLDAIARIEHCRLARFST